VSGLSRQQITKILRELPADEAFYFYVDIDIPAGVSAKSLPDFLDMLKTLPAQSLEFHTSRGDFENWIRLLGDETLARKIPKIRGEGLKDEKLRARLTNIVSDRHAELSKRKPVV
jgi:hypothetical protein